MDLFGFIDKKNNQKPAPRPQKAPLKASLKANLNEIRQTLGNANDLLIRELELEGANKVKVAVLGMDGLINSEFAQQFIIHVLAIDLSLISEASSIENKAIFDTIYHSRISMIDASTNDDFNELYANLLNGHIIVLVDDVTSFMIFDCKGWETRSIMEPTSEKSLRGPKDSFVETIRTNTAMLRKRIKDPRLRFDTHVIGRTTKTDVFVAYIDGLTNPKFVQIANERIGQIDLDGITDVTELNQFIEDQHHTLLPRLTETERPDKVTAALMAGQIAIFLDGSPFAILGPFYFTMAFSSIDDYYSRPFYASLKRIMRYLAYFATILIPSFYIAASTFHQEMIPTSLLVTVINQRESNPFSTFIETLVIIILFEILREASLRKPNVIGDSMTIVGSLIIGQTIVEAGLVSYAAIIVGSITTISSFVISSTRIDVSSRIFTLAFMVIGAWFGLYGITLAFIMLIIHLSSLTTFGEPYLAPMAPFNLGDQKDQIVRMPLSWMKKRPQILKPQNKNRQNLTNQKGGER